MKKFLFTLAALLMAGSLCAQDYFYVEDFEVSQELLQQPTGKARRMTVNVYAHFDYMVSSWQVNMYLPEGVAIKNAEALEGMTIHGMDAVGNPKDYAVALASNFDTQRFIGASMEAGYYYPEGSDPDEDDPVTIGANKWLPGDYLMFSMTLQFDQDFQGGELTIESMLACGQDPRPGTCPKGETNTHVTNITVEGGQVVPQDLTGEITVSEADEAGYVEIGYNGPEDVTVTVTINGEAAEAPYKLAEGDNTIVVTVEAEGYNTLEQTFVRTYTVPAPAQFEGEIIVSEPDENGVVTISYNGPEDVNVTVTINGEEAEAPYQLAEGSNEIVVTVEAPGYEPMTETFTVEYTAPVVPVYTAVPTVTFEVTDDAYTFTAAGDGEVVLYVNGEAVENPYTIARPEAGEDAIEVSVYATAQEAGKEMSQSEAQNFVIEPKAGEQPTDPHMQGYWMVMIKANGEPEWYAMSQGSNGDYTTTVALDYVLYGGFDPLTEERPNVNYYFMIDGVRYGAPDAEVNTVLGTALSNELFAESEGYYYLPVGYNYNMGVAIGPDGDYYVYAAQANFVGIDELDANKTVAGVRYFNLAGQEMQEANGMTIVVTTYTDGTTSAVKVMK